MAWWIGGRSRTLMLGTAFAVAASGCSGEEFPPKEPLANVCSLLKGEEVATVLPDNDGGKEGGQENMPTFWVRSCDYSADLHTVHLAVDGALDDDGSDFLKMGYDAMGAGGTKEEISGVGDEAVFWSDGVEVGVTAKAKGYLVILSALVEPTPAKAALTPLANKAIARLP
ncbi:MAG TPA: hypothetical protein VFV94_21120 [Polyangiaceae bacterium]|nr:hypothetical protein [Polyangiaceae bacterium]